MYSTHSKTKACRTDYKQNMYIARDQQNDGAIRESKLMSSLKNQLEKFFFLLMKQIEVKMYTINNFCVLYIYVYIKLLYLTIADKIFLTSHRKSWQKFFEALIYMIYNVDRQQDINVQDN